LTFGASIFCSEKDKELIIHGDRQDDVFVVPNIYENISFEKINFSNNFDEKNIFLFIGALNYGPNVRGITWFIDNILPKIKERHPDSKLFVVGRNPKKSVIKKCRKMDCVQLFPDALDISEFYKKCRVVVVPLLEGSGTRIKILESALAERPILSTPKGAEGLSLIDNQDLLLFNNAEEFCLKYEKLSNKDDYDDLASNAKKAVKRLYSSKSFATKMRQIMVSIDEKN
jgi:glycosyltransferase involved in cell wall biosynthesis